MKTTYQLLTALACAFHTMGLHGKFKKKGVYYRVYLTPFSDESIKKILNIITKFSTEDTDMQLINYWSLEYSKCTSREQGEILESLYQYFDTETCLSFSYIVLNKEGMEFGKELYKKNVALFEKVAHIIESFSNVNTMGIDLMYITKE